MSLKAKSQILETMDRDFNKNGLVLETLTETINLKTKTPIEGVENKKVKNRKIWLRLQFLTSLRLKMFRNVETKTVQEWNLVFVKTVTR